MARHGPKPKPLAERRRHRVGVYFSDREIADLARLAFPNGTSELSDQAVQKGLGRYIRAAVSGRLPQQVPEINKQAWADLSKSAANLNQIARHLNTDGQCGFDVVEIQAALAAFRNSLLGVS